MGEILKQSKSLANLKKGDKIKVNGTELIVDSHYLFIDHKTTKEMIIEVYNPKNEREFQIRYFDDQIETSIEVYELSNDFQYVGRDFETIEW